MLPGHWSIHMVHQPLAWTCKYSTFRWYHLSNHRSWIPIRCLVWLWTMPSSSAGWLALWCTRKSIRCLWRWKCWMACRFPSKGSWSKIIWNGCRCSDRLPWCREVCFRRKCGWKLGRFTRSRSRMEFSWMCAFKGPILWCWCRVLKPERGTSSTWIWFRWRCILCRWAFPCCP